MLPLTAKTAKRKFILLFFTCRHLNIYGAFMVISRSTTIERLLLGLELKSLGYDSCSAAFELQQENLFSY